MLNTSSVYFVLRSPTGDLHGKKGIQNPSVEDLFSSKRAARSGFTWWNGRNSKPVRIGWQIVPVNINVALDEPAVESL